MDLHPLLARQLRRLGIDLRSAPSESAAWADLLGRVSRAYAEHDQQLALLERSQDLASAEMAELYASLRQERDHLEQRVRERTQALELSQARLASLLSLSADWVWEQDAEMRFTFLSEGLRQSMGIDPSSLLGLRRMLDEHSAISPQDHATYEAAIAARQPFRNVVYTFIGPDGGEQHFLSISGEPVHGHDGRFQGWRGVARDVTLAIVAERRVQALALQDSLTALPNRTQLMEELELAVARARASGTGCAVCFIDLDRFKAVNDTLGHAAGDEVLQTMAERLQRCLRPDDLLARLGGDEFVVLLRNCSEIQPLQAVAERLLHAIAQPLQVQGRSFLLTGSVGLARCPHDGDDAGTLLRQADAAMYQAKESGKNKVHVYSAELTARAERDFATESELRLALHRDELELHYQPKVCARSGRLLGLEALLRWQHPRRGLVMPGDFITLAEERGLIVPLGRWVIGAACRQLQAWQQAGLVPPPVAVNVSPRQFTDPGLVRDIEGSLRAHGLEPWQLGLELTESALMLDPDGASQVLRHLKALGVGVSIDDFGTGYSSLSHLKRFAAGTVKIDRSFVRGLPDDRDDQAITQAVVAMAHSLGMQVVAEGVETLEQLQALRTLGCDQVQGYLLGRPAAARTLVPLLQAAHVVLACPGPEAEPQRRAA